MGIHFNVLNVRDTVVSSIWILMVLFPFAFDRLSLCKKKSVDCFVAGAQITLGIR